MTALRRMQRQEDMDDQLSRSLQLESLREEDLSITELKVLPRRSVGTVSSLDTGCQLHDDGTLCRRI